MPTTNELFDTLTAKVIVDVSRLPLRRQMQVIRKLAEDLSWSCGADKLLTAADEIEADHAENERDAAEDAYLVRSAGRFAPFHGWPL